MATQQSAEETGPSTSAASQGSMSPPPRASTDAPASSSSSSTARKKEQKKRKVGQACVYCRRSHMTCDSERPCKRCIKRDIGHLCHDETPGKGHGHAHHAMPKKKASSPDSATSTSVLPSTSAAEASSSLASIPPTAAPLAANPPATSPPNAEALSAYISALTNTGAASTNGGPYSSQSPAGALRSNDQLSINDVFRPGAGLAGQRQSLGSDPSMIPGPIEGSGAVPPLPQDPWSQITSSAAGLGGAGFLGLGGSDGMQYGGFGGGGGDAAGGNEFNLLSEFLESLDGPSNTGEGMPSYDPSAASTSFDPMNWGDSTIASQQSPPARNTRKRGPSPTLDTSPAPTHKRQISTGEALGAYAPPTLKGFSTKTEKFFLTAADQVDGPREQRLSKVIQAKYDAGLLRPYNYVKGYARLNTWMERNVSPAAKRRILKPLSIFRPRFRAVAQSLSDVDLIFIEEAFERLLLDYDRVFSTQGIPACLWRRTGEIYKGNREFAELVGVSYEELREGRLCIYELMEEESACNYWEKYGAVSFDPGQKAVLTSCVLTAKQGSAPRGTFSRNAVGNDASGAATSVVGRSGTGSRRNSVIAAEGEGEAEASRTSAQPTITKIHCCFSFTIRRDGWGCPMLIAGNFLPAI
ncbi:hypothetical protein BDZ90DRAFT_232760 [Jaminaea rosea]|uniref:Zn(2)-C6 fungal-type domain-containing protein n=1 Tax=Jaminaea rosea TaxID=1569628 RepID=A0A316UPI2_9BASI|nr:hypothetical protein BDZ90DRAFT_232760 [Jaminaea rosea]PWN27216.1 hypothetical protein BDZ90DRAFT_232760 [Jaminaea rosea]